MKNCSYCNKPATSRVMGVVPVCNEHLNMIRSESMKLFKTKASRKMLISAPFWAFLYCYLFVNFAIIQVTIITAILFLAMILCGFLLAWAEDGDKDVEYYQINAMDSESFISYCRDNQKERL